MARDYDDEITSGPRYPSSKETLRFMNKANADSGLPGRVLDSQGYLQNYEDLNNVDQIFATPENFANFMQWIRDGSNVMERGMDRENSPMPGYAPPRDEKLDAMKTFINENKKARK